MAVGFGDADLAISGSAADWRVAATARVVPGPQLLTGNDALLTRSEH